VDGNKEAKGKFVVSDAWIMERYSHNDLDPDKSP
jgi:hypothetical protein